MWSRERLFEQSTPAQLRRILRADRNASSKRPGLYPTQRPGPIRVPVALAPNQVGRKGTIMQLPEILQGASLTRLLQGCAAGAAATLVIGFGWGGWTTASTTQKQVDSAKQA